MMKPFAASLSLLVLVVACSSTPATSAGAHDDAQETCNESGNCDCHQSCSHTCSGNGACQYTCDQGATCSFSCPQGGCTVQGGGSITVDCAGGNCVLQCSGPVCKLTACTQGCRVVCSGAAQCSSTCTDASCVTVP